MAEFDYSVINDPNRSRKKAARAGETIGVVLRNALHAYGLNKTNKKQDLLDQIEKEQDKEEKRQKKYAEYFKNQVELTKMGIQTTGGSPYSSAGAYDVPSEEQMGYQQYLKTQGVDPRLFSKAASGEIYPPQTPLEKQQSEINIGKIADIPGSSAAIQTKRDIDTLTLEGFSEKARIDLAAKKEAIAMSEARRRGEPPFKQYPPSGGAGSEKLKAETDAAKSALTNVAATYKQITKEDGVEKTRDIPVVTRLDARKYMEDTKQDLNDPSIRAIINGYPDLEEVRAGLKVLGISLTKGSEKKQRDWSSKYFQKNYIPYQSAEKSPTEQRYFEIKAQNPKLTKEQIFAIMVGTTTATQ